jgi:hypothetical protein
MVATALGHRNLFTVTGDDPVVFDSLAQHRLYRSPQRPRFSARTFVAGSCWADAGNERRLGLVHVTDAAQYRLTQQQCGYGAATFENAVLDHFGPRVTSQRVWP